MRGNTESSDNFGAEPAFSASFVGTGTGSLPPRPPGPTPLSPGGPSFSPWRQERLEVLEKWFKGVRASALPVRPQLVRLARLWNGKPYKSQPSKRMRFAASTLANLYYRWIAKGPPALQLHYRSRFQPKIGPLEKQAFLKACLEAGTLSFIQGFRKVVAPAALENSYRHALKPIAPALKLVFSLRRRAAKAQKAVTRVETELQAQLHHAITA
jgi:hypothetical protein